MVLEQVDVSQSKNHRETPIFCINLSKLDKLHDVISKNIISLDFFLKILEMS